MVQRLHQRISSAVAGEHIPVVGEFKECFSNYCLDSYLTFRLGLDD